MTLTGTTITEDRLAELRRGTYRLESGNRVRTREQAVDYVNERGFVLFWPIKGIDFPSLWQAVAGDRPVADKHDDPGHVTWGWKDELLGKRKWYYAKLIRHKATLVSLACVPYFYALSENYGEPDKDYLLQYDEGRLSREAKVIYEALLTEGPLHTVELRQKARLTSESASSPFNRAMDQLQADFKVLPVGVAKAGAWKYAFTWDLVHRHYPDLPEQARVIPQKAARGELLRLYLGSVVAAPADQAFRTLDVAHWARPEFDAIVDRLRSENAIDEVELAGRRLITGTQWTR